MKSVIKLTLKKSFVIILGVTLFTSAAFAERFDNSETANKMNVNIQSVTGKNNYNLKVSNKQSVNDVFVTIYDSNNSVVLTEKLTSGKKKYNLSKYNSKSFFFVVESGKSIHTEEVM